MKITAKTDYACRAILELSLSWPNDRPIQISTISKNQDIPIKFLTQIMITLKQLGYVQSIRGKMGGYILIKSPKEITLKHILSDFEPQEYGDIQKKPGSIIDSLWKEINLTIVEKLNHITFENICDKKHSKDNTVMFNI